MEKKIELENYFEIYKSLLTKNMQDVFKLYYNEDLSLREIAKNKGITYQGVFDSLKKTEKTLHDLEGKLKVYRYSKDIEDIKEYINKDIEDIDKIKEIKKIIKKYR